MRRRLARAGALAALALAAACRRGAAPPPGAAGAPSPPKGDVVWLTDPGASGDPALETGLDRLGAAAVFLPAGRLGAGAGPEAFRAAPPPPRPPHIPVVLVVSPDGPVEGAFSGPEGPEPAALARAAAVPLSRLAGEGAFGRVVGVHLDFPYAPAGASRYAAFLGALHRGLPGGVFVSISLRSLPASEDDRRKTAPLLEAADALVSVVFGVGARLDPIATDALHRPWWAAYDTRAVGTVVSASGEARGAAPERLLEPLTGNPRLQFENDLSVNDAAISAFTLTARAPLKTEGLALEAGDRVAFRVPAISEMLFQLGSNLAGKRFALGRAILFGGAREDERPFELAALEDVLLGRALTPALEASVRPAGRNAVAVELSNRSAHASVASRVDNWIEVDLAPAHPADVQPGGFDRYEVYDAAGRPVSPGRATIVRLFETLIAPRETVTPARIVARGALPHGCCRYRIHAVAAAGPEVAGDWIAPPAPEPTKKPAPRVKRG